MPAYIDSVVTGKPQACSLVPGDRLLLYNNETVSVGMASIAFARGMSGSGDDAGTTFTLIFASAPNATVEIQGANYDTASAYDKLSDLTTNNSFYTDTGRFGFYRVAITASSASGQVTVTAQR